MRVEMNPVAGGGSGRQRCLDCGPACLADMQVMNGTTTAEPIGQRIDPVFSCKTCKMAHAGAVPIEGFRLGRVAVWPEGLRPKIAPSGVAGLDRTMTAAGALRLVWHDFGLQRGAAPNGNTP